MITKKSKLWTTGAAALAAAGLSMLPACGEETGVTEDTGTTGGVFEDAGRSLDEGMNRAGEGFNNAGSELERGVEDLGRESEEGLNNLERTGEDMGNSLDQELEPTTPPPAPADPAAPAPPPAADGM